ncbi:hypothetical protein QUA41_17845 [Microcoleus sp. Pol11C1]|uniref:hypothetical protein n=1 Tax=Microcoleus sp. POL1_C1 TaxID=2818870 RepID=UPI002FD375A4
MSKRGWLALNGWQQGCWMYAAMRRMKWIVTLLLLGKQAVYPKLYQKPWCILGRFHRN